ncbi:MAG: hypothetical protein ACM3ZV_01435 [Bacillota bacterium]
MRSMSLLITGTILASCTNAPPPPYMARSASGERAYQMAVAGKVPGQPISCLPNYNANDMSIIDGRTVAFRVGSRTTYIMHLSEGCEMAGSGTYALLSRQIGGPGMCRGDIQSVVDTLNHTSVGSCVIQDIVPYTRP